MGAFISLMSSSFAYEDPLIRQQQQAIGAISTSAKAREIFAEMGRGIWRSGKGFAKVTVLFAGTECVIESVSFRPFFLLRSICVLNACTVSGSERYGEPRCGWIRRWSRPGSQHWAARCVLGRPWVFCFLGRDRALPASRDTRVSVPVTI